MFVYNINFNKNKVNNFNNIHKQDTNLKIVVINNLLWSLVYIYN